MKTFRMLAMIAMASMITALAVPSAAHAGTFGCLVGGGAGGFGGAQIGGGSGTTIATIAGALLGCGVGSSIQNQDAGYQQPQPQYRTARQPRYQQPQYQQPRSRYQQPRPRYQQQAVNSRYNDYAQHPSNRQQRRPQYQQQTVNTVPVLPGGQACPYSREYRTTVFVHNLQVPAYGRACSWDGGNNWELGPAIPAPIQ